MNPKMRTLVIAIIVSIVLWLLGGFVFGKWVGMIMVMVGIYLIGWAAGDVMNSPEPDKK